MTPRSPRQRGFGGRVKRKGGRHVIRGRRGVTPLDPGRRGAHRVAQTEVDGLLLGRHPRGARHIVQLARGHRPDPERPRQHLWGSRRARHRDRLGRGGSSVGPSALVGGQLPGHHQAPGKQRQVRQPSGQRDSIVPEPPRRDQVTGRAQRARLVQQALQQPPEITGGPGALTVGPERRERLRVVSAIREHGAASCSGPGDPELVADRATQPFLLRHQRQRLVVRAAESKDLRAVAQRRLQIGDGTVRAEERLVFGEQRQCVVEFAEVAPDEGQVTKCGSEPDVIASRSGVIHHLGQHRLCVDQIALAPERGAEVHGGCSAPHRGIALRHQIAVQWQGLARITGIGGDPCHLPRELRRPLGVGEHAGVGVDDPVAPCLAGGHVPAQVRVAAAIGGRQVLRVGDQPGQGRDVSSGQELVGKFVEPSVAVGDSREVAGEPPVALPAGIVTRQVATPDRGTVVGTAEVDKAVPVDQCAVAGRGQEQRRQDGARQRSRCRVGGEQLPKLRLGEAAARGRHRRHQPLVSPGRSDSKSRS